MQEQIADGVIMRARMGVDDLERRLRAARDCDAWVAALAEFFAAHGLVFGHGTDNAGDEAFWLLRHLQGWRDVDFGDAAAGRRCCRARLRSRSGASRSASRSRI